MEDLLYKLNPWWEEKYSIDAFPRNDYLSKLIDQFEKKDIVVITGLRRVGKTTLIKKTIEHLTKSVDPKYIFFIPLDTIGFEKYTIHEIIEKYRKLHKIHLKEKIYLFFDEVQYKENFQKELKNLYDHENVKIYISGSSSSILRDKKAYLTGRTRTIEVLPLDFNEYLIFRQVNVKKSEKYLLESYFEEYMEYGGMPEYVLTRDPQYITELIEHVLYKDIVAHHRIKDEKIIKDMFILLCERVGKTISYTKLAKILQTSIDTIKRYIGYFEKSYLVYIIDRYSKSQNERMHLPKKLYIGDIGLRNVTVGFRDLGAVFENLVFLKIKDKKPSYLYKNNTEIDFIYNKTAIESKYQREVSKKQKNLLKESKLDKTVIANNYEFFYG